MQTLTEAEVAAFAVDVIAVGVGEPAMVAIGGSVQQQHE